MLVKEFIQRNGLNTRKHSLYEDKVLVEYKTVRSKTKYEVKLEDLGSDKTYQAENKIPRKIWLVVFLLFPLASFLIQWSEQNLQAPVFVFIAVISWSLALWKYLKKDVDDIFLTGGRMNLVFYRNVPSESDVLEFIQTIINTKNVHLKKHLTRFDDRTQEFEFVARLNYLKNNDIISNEEYDELYNDFRISRLL